MEIVELGFCVHCEELLCKPSISAWGWNNAYFGTVRINEHGDSWWICPPPPQPYVPTGSPKGLHEVGINLITLAKMYCLLHPEDAPQNMPH